MSVTRRTFNVALTLTGLGAITEFGPLPRAAAQSAADIAKPVSLADMSLGAANAPVTLTEYAAPTCPHCARFNRDVFPRIKSEYIDTGKVRYVFREFPLNIKDAACEMVARSIARDDSAKYFAILDVMFRQQNVLLQKTTETLKLIGKQAGLSAEAVENCLKDDGLLAKINADRKFAMDVLKVDGTPTFFINGEVIVGEAPFEDFAKKINPLVKS